MILPRFLVASAAALLCMAASAAATPVLIVAKGGHPVTPGMMRSMHGANARRNDPASAHIEPLPIEQLRSLVASTPGAEPMKRPHPATETLTFKHPIGRLAQFSTMFFTQAELVWDGPFFGAHSSEGPGLNVANMNVNEMDVAVSQRGASKALVLDFQVSGGPEILVMKQICNTNCTTTVLQTANPVDGHILVYLPLDHSAERMTVSLEPNFSAASQSSLYVQGVTVTAAD